MTDKYGFRIAEHCSDKGIRQAYLSMTHGCLISVSTYVMLRDNVKCRPELIPFVCTMQDISYYCCIEVCGDQNDIISSFNSLFSPETGTYM